MMTEATLNPVHVVQEDDFRAMQPGNTDPTTVAACDAAIAAIEIQFKNPPGENRSYADQKARDRRNWIAQALQRGEGESPAVRTYREELAVFEADAALLPEFNRLNRLRTKLFSA